MIIQLLLVRLLVISGCEEKIIYTEDKPLDVILEIEEDAAAKAPYHYANLYQNQKVKKFLDINAKLIKV